MSGSIASTGTPVTLESTRREADPTPRYSQPKLSNALDANYLERKSNAWPWPSPDRPNR